MTSGGIASGVYIKSNQLIDKMLGKKEKYGFSGHAKAISPFSAIQE
ncbi:MAG: hypothetical protein H8E25_07725 [Planctomycetes bacterium]|nr:hypothetical protein [Planctomycetota bacterium]